MSISLVFITQSYFSVPKEVKINSAHYLITTIHNKRELRNIATNHSANIGYKDFMNFCRKCTNKPRSFFTIDTTLPGNNPLRFRKKCFTFIIKMKLTDGLKILGEKIKTNQDQYDLDIEAAKTSSLSSKELYKYEYLISEDLKYKPGVVEQVRFEYSPLGEALNNKIKSKIDKPDKIGREDKKFD